MHSLCSAIRRFSTALGAMLGVMTFGAALYGQSVGGVQLSTGNPAVRGQMPDILKGVNFEQRLGEQVPLDAAFVDEQGKPVTLSSYFGKKPVVIILAYYRCPMLCSEVLHGATSAFKRLSFHIGDQFNVLTVSIDPEETPAIAIATKQTYIQEYGDPSAAAGWHFLTGEKPEIDKLADAVGFHYKYIPQIDQYAHAAGIVVVTPEGKVAQYFYGIRYAPEDLRLALVQSSQDQIGSVVDQILLYCCTYDPDTGKYHAIISRVLKIAAGFTILLIGGGLLMLFRWDARHKRRHAQASSF